ncbi:hypothetical protein CPC08DRAFT_716089 [Agrocybe pediades]|nr:hypothetical protein CPC08DRAFT_716089 [Agrocybe pediades]
MPSAYNMPAMPLPSTPPSRSAELPLQPVRPVRHSVISRNTSVDTHTLARSETETVSSQTQSQSVSTNYPLDVKRPIVTNQSSGDSVLSSDDSASLVSSSSNLVPVRPRNRPISVHSRAPTYVPRSTSNLRGVVIQELDDSASELPPMYGQHVADPSLNYAPSILSSGSRF